MLTTVLAFLLTLGVLIVIHEYGHYRVAVACGVDDGRAWPPPPTPNQGAAT